MVEGRIVAVLAGGEGRRMGGVKALRPFRGTTLLAHAVALARRWSDEVAVVVRDPAQAGGLAGVTLIRDREDIEGPLGGLAAALAHAAARGAARLMTLPCDMPDLPADLAVRLEAGLGEAVVALPQVAEALEPACGLWRTQALAALDPYLAEGRTSLHGFARAAGLAVVDFGDAAAGAFANLNTLDALAALDGPLAPPDGRR
jgi:molybdopterin-guanine dinucleotide biosynthesis protein A